MTVETLARMIDHTCLKASAGKTDIEKLCREAELYGFASVCVNSNRVKDAYFFLHNKSVKICAVAGFPLGAMSTESKAFEAAQAVNDGADEIDMVISVGHAKEKDWTYVEHDIQNVIDACTAEAGKKNKTCLVKVILETCYLSNEEIIEASLCAKRAGAHFLKTSTGFGTGGALEEHVHLMREIAGTSMGVKASGGIKTLESAFKMINAGANRLGLSSGIDIIKELSAAR